MPPYYGPPEPAGLRTQPGAKAILTQNGRTADGPCVTIRAPIGNKARADAALAIHADGGPPGGYGFAILVPELVQRLPPTTARSSGRRTGLPTPWSATSPAVTGQNVSTYPGSGGIRPRNDLAGLNLSTVPKVFIECANMRKRTRHREGHQRALAAARRPGHRRFDQRLPRRQVTTGPPIRPRQTRGAAFETSPTPQLHVAILHLEGTRVVDIAALVRQPSVPSPARLALIARRLQNTPF
jgi:hypothetical protein